MSKGLWSTISSFRLFVLGKELEMPHQKTWPDLGLRAEMQGSVWRIYQNAAWVVPAMASRVVIPFQSHVRHSCWALPWGVTCYSQDQVQILPMILNSLTTWFLSTFLAISALLSLSYSYISRHKQFSYMLATCIATIASFFLFVLKTAIHFLRARSRICFFVNCSWIHFSLANIVSCIFCYYKFCHTILLFFFPFLWTGWELR